VVPSHVVLMILVACAITAPAIVYGIFGAHDLVAYHLRWSKHFGEQLWHGDLYPRWLIDMNGGFGSPTFFTYGPAAYYATALLWPLFKTDPLGWYQVGASAAAAVVLSGLTFNLWARDIVSARAALIGALIYMTLPYHVAVDLYTRFAFGELWAFVWIPLILFFARRMIRAERMPLVGFALSLAMLLMTHIIAFVMFAPVAVSYGPFVAGGTERVRTFARTIGGIVLAVGLGAIYWIPAIGTQSYVTLGAPAPDAYVYANNFLFWHAPISHSVMFWHALEVVTTLSVGLAGCAFFASSTANAGALGRERRYLMGVVLLSAFMTCPLSKPVWALLPPLQRMEFPWRFNVLVVVATGGLTAIAMDSVRNISSLLENATLKVGVMMLTGLFLAACLIVGTQLQRISDADVRDLEVSVDGPAFKPNATPLELFNPDGIRALKQRINRVRVDSGQGRAAVLGWAPRSIALETNARTDLVLTLGQFYYPGWTARLGKEGGSLAVRPSVSDGLVQIEVPSGDHQVVVTLEPGSAERGGQLGSVVAAVVLLSLMVWFRRLDRAPGA